MKTQRCTTRFIKRNPFSTVLEHRTHRIKFYLVYKSLWPAESGPPIIVWKALLRNYSTVGRKLICVDTKLNYIYHNILLFYLLSQNSPWLSFMPTNLCPFTLFSITLVSVFFVFHKHATVVSFIVILRTCSYVYDSIP